MILGADVASYQPGIDWLTYVKYGRSFVMIKITEGTSYLNPQAMAQVDGAEAAGVAVGCYHYVSWQDAPSEADYFVGHVRNLTVLTGVPLAIDVERGAYTLPANPQEYLDALLGYIEALAGYPPLVYSSASYLASVGLTIPARNGQWLALWGSTPPAGLAPSSFWALWQHAAGQSLPGVPTPVDCDIFNGTVEQFRLYGGR